MAVGRIFRQMFGAVPVFLLIRQRVPTINESSSLIYSQLLAASIGGVKSSADAALSNELSKRFDS